MNPIVAILGVGSGLGKALARRFARGGCTVALMSRSLENLQVIQASLAEEGYRIFSFEADARDSNSVSDGFSQVKEQLGDPEVFIYNAGTFQMGGILEITPEKFEECWKANCFGAFLGAQQVLPAMSERRQGTILLTGATAALRGSARFSCLAVGKFGLRALAQSMAREFNSQGIHIAHIIIDGQIDIPKLRAKSPDRAADTLLSPDAIAETYWQLYQQDPSVWTLELDLRPSLEKF
ncbi:SDR family NAD(P)-dependent oxidoreductase [Pseudanabaena sp. UWO311]|uniref:SDR family NAD(P)-dependent oxidoreductase n=1 Tax=Pseudanabaena sp. UWO311 TaxID=2487337 RepID=UPI00115B723C|nr:SDR family NAD(P)-dependent oxidoreductase [Pseudanabaena sp. UWO311]TYQ27796.1 SDR family NAD(P)-dependent oxidoreductase [Pseudanabaena sp. UWO311]